MNNKIIISMVLLFSLLACTDDSAKEKQFIKTYKEILVARESFPDSAIANRKVEEIIKKNGFTQNSFKDAFFDLSQDKIRFTKLIDSLRTSIIKDTVIFK